jgi:hypothetical protein
MATRHYVDKNGNYLGGFSGYIPPPTYKPIKGGKLAIIPSAEVLPEIPKGAIEVTIAPEDGAQVWDGKVWTWPKNVLADRARRRRDGLLAESDWSQAKDIPEALSKKYAEYRQALRDIPSQVEFPETIVWPEVAK